MTEQVTKAEYNNHKKNCSNSFEIMEKQLELLNRAMFGEEKLKKKGLVDMTSEMYERVMVAKGTSRAFIFSMKIAGAIIAFTGAFWAVYEFISRVKIK